MPFPLLGDIFPVHNQSFNEAINQLYYPAANEAVNPANNPAASSTVNAANNPLANQVVNPAVNSVVNLAINPQANLLFNPAVNPNLNFDVVGVLMWIKHLHVLCHRKVAIVEYVLNWIAQALQFPAIKIGIMLVFIGNEGIGKSLFTDSLSCLFGKEKFLTTATPEDDIWGTHNALMASAYLVILSRN
jgi:hypothetical protein